MIDINTTIATGTSVMDIMNQIEILTDDMQNCLEEMAHLFAEGAMDNRIDVTLEGLSGVFGVLRNAAHMAHAKASYVSLQLAREKAQALRGDAQ